MEESSLFEMHPRFAGTLRQHTGIPDRWVSPPAGPARSRAESLVRGTTADDTRPRSVDEPPPVRGRRTELLGRVLIQALDEPHHVDDHSLMRAGSNGRNAICCFDLELDAATIDFGDLRSRDDLPADRRGR